MGALDATLRAFGLLLTGDAALWHLVWVSLATSLAGLLLAAPPALLLGYQAALHPFRWRRAIAWLAQAMLAVPTLLVGLLLYLLLAPAGPLGDLRWLFAEPGMVLGVFVVTFPVLFAYTLAAVQAVDPLYAETALALGGTRSQVMLRVLHEARFGVMAAILLGFGRAIAEIGGALVLGGNIAGHTRSLGTALALEAGRGDVGQAIALGIVLLAFALPLTGVLAWLQGAPRVLRRQPA
ncbi:ABC transporter permease [Massilia sp. TN1-12]|uniref:ABC transporter permease n=1 Tax=Massilia paldalensis TaxID=3377675 RepID=UPI00384C2B34